MEERDITWTFPTELGAAETPSLALLRQMVVACVEKVLERLHRGADILQVADTFYSVPSGWEHWHWHPELFLQVRGKSRFLTPHEDIVLEPGGMLLFPPLSAHSEFVEGDRAQFRNFVFTMAERSVSYHLSHGALDGANRPRVVLPDVVPVEEAMAGALPWLMASPDPDVRAGALRALLGIIKRAATVAPLPGQTESDRVRAAQQLIRSRLGSSSLTVGQVAQWVGCHADHLTRTFRRETNQTVVGFIASERLNLAHTLLADSRIRVSDAARLAGFSDPAYFSRLYRQRFGEPPSSGKRSWSASHEG